ncbi:MAG: LamG-like jellyroll fold domain-containing protein, partial [Planctomycetota bacterium]
GDVLSFSTPPGGAYNPNPVDGIINVATDVTLNWTASWNPAMYSVNFGTDRDAVANAAPAAAQPDVGFDPGPLATSTTYYWRVDVLYSSGWYRGKVWSFTTLPEIALVEDPNLITWWPLDEAAGRTTLDMSGHGHHGTFIGEPQWAEGIDDGGLEFDGLGDQVEHLLPEATTFPSFTIALWVKAASVGQAQYASAFSGHTPNSAGLQIDVDGGDPGVYRINPPGGTQLVFGPVVADWAHLTLVGEGISLQFYYNGNLAMTGDVTDNDVLINQFVVGAARSRTSFFAGTIDDFRYYDRALGADEVKQLTRTDPAQAWDPAPISGATGDIWTMGMLAWQPGDGAVEHDVYLATDAGAVEAADASDATGIYRGRQADAAYLVPDGLEFATTYYWRVDEVAADGTVSTGRIWSLTTLDEIVIYGDETPFPYDNSTDPFLSEISLDMDPPLNLTDPIGRLAVSYTGAAAGGSVAVDDAAGTITVVGRGADIWGTADQFQYAYTMLTGDGSMTVKVDSLAHTDNWSKAGIMIRQTLDAGSPFAAVYATGTNGVRFQARMMADQDATSDSSVATDEQKALNAPVWLKIERAFPMINAYYSTDGATWTPMSWNPQVIPMTPAPIYIGLAVTSHSGETTFAEAVFSELSSEGGVAAGPLTSTEVGLVSNAAEPMYLVLQDASGASAAVMNPDPAATQQTSATDFIVELADFNIDLSAVVKATLVIGNLEAPAPGGAGLLTIHNVRLLPRLPLVVWVSFHGADDEPSAGAAGAGFTEAADKPYTDLLKANGYNVMRYVTTNSPDAAVLNAADLVIISRSAASSGYQNDGATAWNGISAPMIIVNGYILRSSRMGYTTGGTMVDTTGDITLTVSDPTHPIFAGISLTDGTMTNPYAGVVTYPDGTLARGVSINNDPVDDEATVLATISEASAAAGPVGGMVIAEWPAGATLTHSGGAGTDVLAGPRLVILTGAREASGISSETAGLYDLYDDGAQMLLNAVDYMIE